MRGKRIQHFRGRSTGDGALILTKAATKAETDEHEPLRISREASDTFHSLSL
jgi:hypothetical protein